MLASDVPVGVVVGQDEGIDLEGCTGFGFAVVGGGLDEGLELEALVSCDRGLQASELAAQCGFRRFVDVVSFQRVDRVERAGLVFGQQIGVAKAALDRLEAGVVEAGGFGEGLAGDGVEPHEVGGGQDGCAEVVGAAVAAFLLGGLLGVARSRVELAQDAVGVEGFGQVAANAVALGAGGAVCTAGFIELAGELVV